MRLSLPRDMRLPDAFKLVLGKDLDKWPVEARLVIAAYDGDVRLLKEMAKSMDKEGKGIGVTLVNTNFFGTNVLHAACNSGNIPIFQYLVEELNMDVNMVDNVVGFTPLMHATYNGKLPAVRSLLDNGADLHQRHKNASLLLTAIEKGNSEIAKFLISRGVNVHDASIVTPLEHAAIRGYTNILKILLEHFPNHCFIKSDLSTLADPHATKAYKLSRKNKKELDKEKDCTQYAESLRFTQEYVGTLNLNVTMTTGGIFEKQSVFFQEHLNVVDLVDNNVLNISSSDHKWFCGSCKEEEHIQGSIASFVVKVEGESISVRQNLSTTTIRMLLDHIYEKKRIRNYDGYAVYLGKVLDGDMLLVDCKVCNNCIVEVRGRGRGGGKERKVKCKTFDEEMEGVELFNVVPLPGTLRHISRLIINVTFLSEECKWRARQVLISLGRMHFRKKSFNGKFNSSHILFHDGRVLFDESLEEVDYTEGAGKNDHGVIAKIFEVKFRIPGKSEGLYSYPVFVEDLVSFLSKFPLGEKSNSDAGIALLINHPALIDFMDRIRQCSILDSMVDKLSNTYQEMFEVAVGNYKWPDIAECVPAMFDILVYDPLRRDEEKANRKDDSEKVAPASTSNVRTGVIVPSKRKADHLEESSEPALEIDELTTVYLSTKRSCLKFSRNLFEHAKKDLFLERIEASFSLHFEDFLPVTLRDIVMNVKAPPAFKIVTLLGDHVVDVKRKRKDDENVGPMESPEK